MTYYGWEERTKRERNVSALLGETLAEVSGMEPGSEAVTFVTASGRTFRMYHDQDCCESVSVNEIIGNVADLIGSPLTMAEEVSNEGFANPWDSVEPDEYGYRSGVPESFTWTFYRFATVKGYVTLRWLGESNGYYSESVSFMETTPEVAP